MNQELWRQIEELYCAAQNREPAQQAAILADCSPEVREAVLRMLAPAAPDNILDRPFRITEGDRSEWTLLKTGTQLGPYKVQTLLGQGGMGAVYRASDSRLNRDVAIKTLPRELVEDPNRARRFEQEARAVGTLSHPNILTVFDVGNQEGTSYLVTELLDGQTLRDRLRSGKLRRATAVGYARMIAAGLIAAHSKGITHQDLKPENLFLTRDGRLKILDFGLATFKAADGQASGLARGTVVGTIGYMSPEQALGERVDHRSDLFNLGVVLYEMLTGRRPFHGESPAETQQAILKEDPSLGIPEIDHALGRFLQHCLEKNPADRFQSASDLAFDLDGLESSTPAAPSATSARRSRALLWVSAAGIVVATLAAFLATRPGVQPSFHRITFRAGNITTARFTPDGGTIVYSAAWDGKPVEPYTTSNNGPESRPLGIPMAGVAGVSATGELALMLGCEINWGECSGTLARAPLGGGAPREVQQGVDYADWDRQGNLAVVRFSGGRARIEYPIGHLLYESSTGWISHLRFSPKGDLLAFFDHPRFGDNDGSLEIVDLQGKRTTLASGRRGLKGLAWRPAGDEVWYSGSEGRAPVLRAVTVAGRERTVLEAPGWTEILDIARNGSVLLLRQDPRANVVFSSLRTNTTRLLTWFDWSTTADLSADGAEVLFYEWGEASGGVPLTYLRDSAGGEAVRLGEGKPLALSPNRQSVLAWRPASGLVVLPVRAGQARSLPNDGISACYSGAWFPGGDKVLFVGEKGGDSIPRSFVQGISGEPARQIAPEGVRAALISPDGAQLAAYGSNGDFFRLPAGGGDLQPIRGLERGDELLQWSADGLALYVRDSDESRLNLFRVELDTGRRSRWRTLSIPDQTGFLGIESGAGAMRVTPDGAAAAYTFWQARGELYLAEGLR